MGYNFRTMLKRLRIIAIGIFPWIIGSAVVGGAIVFVASKQHHAAEEYEAAREKRCASSFPLDSEKQNACKYERDNPGNYLPWGYVLVAWPEGITTWAILATLIVIGCQAIETRKTSEAALTQSKLQAAAMRQWVDVEVSGIDAEESATDAFGVLRKSLDITVSFKAINNTPYALTTKRIEIQLYRGKGGNTQWEPFVIDEERILPPSSLNKERSHHVSIPIQLNEAEVENFANFSLVVPVKGTVFFEPAIPGKMEEQSFDLIAKFGPSLARTLKSWWANMAVPDDSYTESDG